MADHRSVQVDVGHVISRRRALADAGRLMAVTWVGILAACGQSSQATSPPGTGSATLAASASTTRAAPATGSTVSTASAALTSATTRAATDSSSATSTAAATTARPASTSAAQAAAPSKAGSLHVLHEALLTSTQKSLWAANKATFLQQHPGVTIEEDLTNDLFTKMPTLVAAGTPPDVAPIRNFAELIMFAPYDVLLQLDPYLARSSVLPKADFYPKTLVGNSLAGKLYALPTTVDMDGLFYNQDLFDAAGVKYPDLTWDYNDWLSAATKLTKRQGTTITQIGGLLPDWWVIQYLGNFGVAPWQGGVEQPGACTRVNYDHPNVIKGYQWYQDVTCKNPVNLPAPTKGQPNLPSHFTGGSAAMLLSYDQRSGFVNTIKNKFRWGWTLAPLGDKKQPRKQTTAFYGDGIFAQSQAKDLAWGWLEVTDAPAAQIASVKALGASSVYANRKVQESPTYLASPIPPADKKVLVQGLDSLWYVPQPFWEMKALKVNEPSLPKGTPGPQDCGANVQKVLTQQATVDNAALKQHSIAVCA